MKKLVPIEHLRDNMITAEPVFAHGKYTPLVLEGARISSTMIRQLKEHGVTHANIEMDDEMAAEFKFLDEIKHAHHEKNSSMSSINQPEQPKQPAPPKPDTEEIELLFPNREPIESVIDNALRQEAISGIRNLFSTATDQNMTTAYHAVKELDTVIDQLVDTLSAESSSLVHIADLKSYDEYTYHHSLSVAVLSIAIGQAMGLSEPTLKHLGRAAIMHDIGKMFVPTEIVNKPGKLSDDEFFTMKSHPRFGYDYLCRGKIGDEEIRQGVLCHHEKVDGSGYPNHLTDKKIPLFSCIIAVADVYDAVTSYRSYRKPMPPSQAIELVMSEVGRAFNFEVVKVFMDKLELYPINTCVELSNHRCGVVTDNSNSMRPIIKMADSDEIIDLMALNSLHLVITRVLEDGQGFM